MRPIPPSFLECLEAIYRLEQEGTPPSLALLGKRLELGKPLVMERALGLQGIGLIETRPTDRVVLTAEGERIAVGLVRKHRLLEALPRRLPRSALGSRPRGRVPPHTRPL